MIEFKSQVDSVDSDGENVIIALSNLEGNVSVIGLVYNDPVALCYSCIS
jgi:hypothetical protein